MRTTNLDDGLKTVTEFNKPNVRAIAQKITENVQDYAQENDLVITYLGSSYNDNEITVKLSITHAGKDHKDLKNESQRRTLEMFYPHLVDATFISVRFGKAKIVGYNPRCRKYEFVCEQIDVPNPMKFRSVLPHNVTMKVG